ncbi:hypothetical protein PHAMO_30146 [Magnetospirillum molischianum DSM 120]|uniref:Uncharacterized protein n=1 Tax=Magnetospirillum molischianum DSM 120 TaxID=1150626 RepID=H8FUF2_MAGML|nr:hypothetical protein PHAMO_30146 [Magnetospirillum molischianum DSM 120]
MILATAGLLTRGSLALSRLPGYPVASWDGPPPLQLREQPRIFTVFPFAPRLRGPLLTIDLPRTAMAVNRHPTRWGHRMDD